MLKEKIVYEIFGSRESNVYPCEVFGLRVKANSALWIQNGKQNLSKCESGESKIVKTFCFQEM